MARRVGMLMPQAGSAYDAVAAEHLGPYRAGFADAGITLVPRPWDMRPDEGDVALALFAWGYHFDVARWDALLATWRPRASRSCRADAVSVAAALDAFGCDERVVKAQISAGSDKTGRVRRGERLAPLHDAIIQPFLPAIANEGKLSLFAIGGAYSHAAWKVATGGDFPYPAAIRRCVQPLSPGRRSDGGVRHGACRPARRSVLRAGRSAPARLAAALAARL